MCPDQPVMLWFPCAGLDFIAWLEQFPHVTLMPERLAGDGWNVKPNALLAAFERGASQAWWIDSDVIVTRNFIQAYQDVPDRDFIVAEEALYGNAEANGARARAWGFEVTRVLPFCMNSGVMRASRAHLPLLERWQTLLGSPAYRAAQQTSGGHRPVHLHGDQDVLTACLAGPFGNVPLRYLYRGKDIIQYFGPAGYSPDERFRNLFLGLPCFIHSMGASKPWRSQTQTHGASSRFSSLYAELSPYKAVALRYPEELTGEAWKQANRATPLGRLLRLAGFGSAPLTGLPLALAYSTLRTVKRLTRRLPRR